LDCVHIVFREFYAQCLGHRFNVLDSLDTNDGEDVSRLVKEVRQSLFIPLVCEP
jgi:hypothetical protein